MKWGFTTLHHIFFLRRGGVGIGIGSFWYVKLQCTKANWLYINDNMELNITSIYKKHGRAFNKNNPVGPIQMQENQNHSKLYGEQEKSWETKRSFLKRKTKIIWLAKQKISFVAASWENQNKDSKQIKHFLCDCAYQE